MTFHKIAETAHDNTDCRLSMHVLKQRKLCSQFSPRSYDLASQLLGSLRKRLRKSHFVIAHPARSCIPFTSFLLLEIEITLSRKSEIALLDKRVVSLIPNHEPEGWPIYY